MRSTFFGLEVGRRALHAHTRTQDVIGHNIANAATPGYSRQEAVLHTTAPLYAPYVTRPETPGQVGTGVEVVQIKRYRDIFLDSQIRNGTMVRGTQEVIFNALRQIEEIFNEPSDDGLNKAFSAFWSAWEELTKHPESVAVRTNVMEVAVSLVDVAQKINFEMRQLQSDYDTAIRQEVINVNIKASEIASLNERIAKIQDLGDSANDLKDRRDVLLDELSELINLQYFENARGQVTVIVGNSTLVRDDHYFQWFGAPMNEYAAVAATRNEKTAVFSNIRSEEHELVVDVTGGKIGGYVYVRDVVIPDVLDMYDQLMESFIIRVNSIHTQGYGLDGSTDNPFFYDTEVQIPHTGVLNPTWNNTYMGETVLPAGTRTSRTLADLGVTIVPGVNDEIHINNNVIVLNATDTLETALEKIQREAAINAYYDIEAGRIVFSRLDPKRYNEDSLVYSTTGQTVGANVLVDASNPFTTVSVGDYLLIGAEAGEPMGRYRIISVDGAGQITVEGDPFAGGVALPEYRIEDATPINMNMDGNSCDFLAVMGFFAEDPLAPGVYHQTAVPTVTSYHNSDTTSRMQVNPEIIRNVNKIAVAADYLSLPGDNTIGLLMADLKNQLTMSGVMDSTATVRHTATFQEYYNSLISKVGVDAQSASRAYRNQQLILEEYEKRRIEAIGVSLDEELTKMIQAQKSFNSASRMITTIDEMLDRIINNMGLVGR